MIESVLAPGERLLWQGRPTGYRISWAAFVGYLVVLGSCALLTGWLVWQRGALSSFDDSFGIPSPTLLILYNGVDLKPATGILIQYDSLRIPHPLAVGALLVATCELLRFAAWCGRRYAITDRRAIMAGALGKPQELPLTDAVKGMARAGQLLIESPIGRMSFEGLEDTEAALFWLNEVTSTRTRPSSL
jgi:hypothetical protein